MLLSIKVSSYNSYLDMTSQKIVYTNARYSGLRISAVIVN